MNLIHMAWHFLRTQKSLVCAVTLCQLGQVLLSLWLPSLNGTIIDEGIIPGNKQAIWLNGSLMLIATIVQIACMIGAIYAGSRVSMECGRSLRHHIFRKVQSFSPTEHHRFGAPTLITRTTNDINQVQMVVLMTFTVMITAPIMGIGGIVMALQQDIKLSLLLLVIVPALGAIIAAVMMGLTPRYKTQQQRIDRINTLLREQLTGVRVIRAFVRQRTKRQEFAQANEDLRSIWLQIGWLWAFLMPATMLVIGASSTTVIWFGGLRIESGAMHVGALTAYINYLMMILGAVMMSGMMAMMFPRGVICANRLHEIDTTVPSIRNPRNPHALANTSLTFELRDATVQYEGAEKPVIEHANIVLSPGKRIAMIGSTGSGKSSLIKLFPRMIDATAGSVCVNGINVRDLDLSELRSRIALVPQHAFLFTGTIASNVAGFPTILDMDPAQPIPEELDEQRVRTALQAAQAWDFVDALEDGIHTHVESGGLNFSGGQRQRITIARALYRCLPDSHGHRQADLLIFDDSFSALDFATDAALRNHLSDFIGDIAVLIVAQRVATIRDASEILVLGDGKILARGTHRTLMQISPTYREIVTSQLTSEEAA